MTVHAKQRGDIAIYTAIIVVTIMLSGALAMSTILSRQIPATAQLLDAEKAFYAANTGREQGFYILAKQPVPAGAPTARRDIQGIVTYRNASNASYDGYIEIQHGAACGIIDGAFNNLRRRIAVGSPEVDCSL